MSHCQIHRNAPNNPMIEEYGLVQAKQQVPGAQLIYTRSLPEREPAKIVHL